MPDVPLAALLNVLGGCVPQKSHQHSSCLLMGRKCSDVSYCVGGSLQNQLLREGLGKNPNLKYPRLPVGLLGLLGIKQYASQEYWTVNQGDSKYWKCFNGGKRISAGPGLLVFTLPGTYFSVFWTAGQAAPWSHLTQAESPTRPPASVGTGLPLPSLLAGHVCVEMIPIVPSTLNIKIFSSF